MAGRSILIVDDNPINLKLVRAILGAEGYAIHTAADAEAALGLLAALTPDLILMDIQLPGMDGLELTRRLRADPLHADLVIVALTASAMKGDDDKARAAGCDGYITKPIEPDTLTAMVAGHLAAGRAGGRREGR